MVIILRNALTLYILSVGSDVTASNVASEPRVQPFDYIFLVSFDHVEDTVTVTCYLLTQVTNFNREHFFFWLDCLKLRSEFMASSVLMKTH